MVVMYQASYASPLGLLVIESDGTGLTGLTFSSTPSSREDDLPLFHKVRTWLDSYFLGKKPRPDFPLVFQGTVFQKTVWSLLTEIPYGDVISYKDLSLKVASVLGKERMSCQAVGTAVGRNPIALIVPCHRVIGSHHQLGGYAFGPAIKRRLLSFEGVDVSKLKA